MRYSINEVSYTIDYRCEDGCFLVSTSCMTIANPTLLSSIETVVNPGIRWWKQYLSECVRCQKAVGGIYFTKKWRAEALQPGLEFDNFKPRLERSIFKYISWLNGSVFSWCWWSGFYKRGDQDLPNGTKWSSRSLNPATLLVQSTILIGRDVVLFQHVQTDA